nr:YHYH domain-containing protein [Paenibacillus odorifer]
MPVLAEAHPGRTDANGVHYCRTNCAKWGLENGEYQYHNGGGSDSKPAATFVRR